MEMREREREGGKETDGERKSHPRPSPFLTPLASPPSPLLHPNPLRLSPYAFKCPRRGGHRVAITVVVPRAYFWGPHRSICPASGRSVCPNGSKPWRDADGPREEAEDWEFWRHPGTWGLGPKPQLVRVYRVYSPSLHEFASSVSGPCEGMGGASQEESALFEMCKI